MKFIKNDASRVIFLVSALVILAAMIGAQAFKASQSNEVKLSQVRYWHERDFTNIKTYLERQELAFAFKPAPTHYNDETEGCSSGEVMREWGSEKIPIDCYKYLRLRPALFDGDFISRWKSSANDLERFIQDDGWRKEYRDQTSLEGLFDQPKDNASFLAFIKDHGPVRCEIRFMYNPPYPNLDDQTWMDNDCKRND